MLKSMTGFGKVVSETNKKRIIVEIKSLNSKQFDINLKLPYIYREKEHEIRTLLSKKLERGKIEILVYFENKSVDKSAYINKEIIQLYYNDLKSIHDQLEIKNEPDWLNIIMRFPDVLNQPVAEIDNTEWVTVLSSIQDAAIQLMNFREKEGNVLETELLQRIRNIELLHHQIDEFENHRIENVKNRLTQNLNELNCNDMFDKNRFEQELIYYLEKFDFTEERIRLKNHCNYFKETCNEEYPGRKLAFITQEIGREINTLGSKANQSDIQRKVVQMKDELEKIKEQLLNIL
jgi:uncharacterized protein (TIGR00255 family)